MLANREAFLVQQCAVLASDLDSPLTGAVTLHQIAAIRAVTRRSIGLDAKFHGVAQVIALVPTMLNRGGTRRFDLRVQEQRARRNGTVCRIARPVVEVPAKTGSDHYRSRSAGRSGFAGVCFIG